MKNIPETHSAHAFNGNHCKKIMNEDISLMRLVTLIQQLAINIFELIFCSKYYWGRRGRDGMVVGLTTTYTISIYHH